VCYVLALGAAATWRVFHREMPATWLAWGALAPAATVAPYYAYVAATGSIAEHVFLNWTLNVPSGDEFSAVHGLMESFEQNGVLWIAFLTSPFLVWRSPRHRELVFVAGALLATMFLARRPWPQYFLMFLPLASVCGAAALCELLWRRTPAYAVALGLAVLPAAYHFELRGYRTNTHQLAAVEHVLSQTAPDDRVYDGGATINVFRPDLDYFWFSVGPEGLLHRYREHRPYPFDPYELVRRERPRVVGTLRLPDFPGSETARCYRRSETVADVFVRID
jgi:hypothetical protein